MSEDQFNHAQLIIRIVEMKCLSFEVSARFKELKEALTADRYEFQFELSSNAIEAEKSFEVLLLITLFEKQKGSAKVELASLKSFTVFQLGNYAEMIRKEGNDLLIADQLIEITGGLALSASRGMFSMSVANSVISNSIIPIIDPWVCIPT